MLILSRKDSHAALGPHTGRSEVFDDSAAKGEAGKGAKCLPDAEFEWVSLRLLSSPPLHLTIPLHPLPPALSCRSLDSTPLTCFPYQLSLSLLSSPPAFATLFCHSPLISLPPVPTRSFPSAIQCFPSQTPSLVPRTQVSPDESIKEPFSRERRDIAALAVTYDLSLSGDGLQHAQLAGCLDTIVPLTQVRLTPHSRSSQHLLLPCFLVSLLMPGFYFPLPSFHSSFSR